MSNEKITAWRIRAYLIDNISNSQAVLYELKKITCSGCGEFRVECDCD